MMKRFAFFVLLGLLANAGLAENRALIVGIGRYESAEIREIPGIDRDIAMMRESLRTLGFADSQIRILRHADASLDNIREALDWLARGTTPSDRALFYHSGHGTRIEDVSHDEDDGTDEALVPYDALVRDGRKEPSHLLVDDEIGRRLQAIPAREVVVLVDSCFSAGVTRSLSSPTKFYGYPDMPRGQRGFLVDKALENRDSVILLSAARPDEEAQASPDGALFTQGIREVIRRSASQRQLTLEELQCETEDFIRRTLIRLGHEQLRHHPVLEGASELRRINLFLPDPELRETVEAPDPPDLRPPGELEGGDLWSQLEIAVRDAADLLQVRTSKTVYRAGESLELWVDAPADGYLHVLNVGDGEDQIVVLYPNRYQSNNRVRRGETIHIPEAGRFRLLARLPASRRTQKNLLAAMVTPQPLPLDQYPTSPEEIFQRLDRDAATRSIQRVRRPSHHYSAGQVVVTIED